MKLVIRRNQDTGFLGGMSFTLHAQAVVTPEEQALISKYKAQKLELFSAGNRKYTINDLLTGVSDKVKDVTVLLQNEEVYKDACKHFKTMLDVMASFGGEEVVDY